VIDVKSSDDEMLQNNITLLIKFPVLIDGALDQSDFGVLSLHEYNSISSAFADRSADPQIDVPPRLGTFQLTGINPI
jgi:hypothetical protein